MLLLLVPLLPSGLNILIVVIARSILSGAAIFCRVVEGCDEAISCFGDEIALPLQGSQ
jgi:hypothetical protein